MCCLNPTRPGIIEFVFRGFNKMLTCGLSGWLELDHFPWIVNNKRVTFASVSSENPHTQISPFNNYITPMNQIFFFLTVVIIWGREGQRCCTQSSYQPVFHIRRVYFPDFSRHISHLCFLSRCQREKEKHRSSHGVMFAFKERTYLYLF